jgi:hypothetical protein
MVLFFSSSGIFSIPYAPRDQLDEGTTNKLLKLVGINTAEATQLNSTTTIGTNVSKTVIGTTINITATTINTLFGTNTNLYTTLVIVGRDSGARISIPVQIVKVNQ